MRRGGVGCGTQDRILLNSRRWSSPQPPGRDAPGLMTPGCQAAPGVFSSVQRKQPDWRSVATISDWGVWGDWNLGEIRAAGACSDQDGKHVSLWHAADQSDGVFFPWTDRADSAESRDCAAGMADGDCGGIFRRIHHIFELRMGNGEDARGRGVGVGKTLTGGARGDLGIAFGW